MSDKLKRTIIGAVIAVALAAGVSYGLISQQTADNLQQKANQSLATNEPTANREQPAPQAPEPQDGDARPPAQPDPQNPPASRP